MDRRRPGLGHPLVRLASTAVVISLVFSRWPSFPWNMPLVGLLGISLVWLETRSLASAGMQRQPVLRSLAWIALLFVGTLLIGMVISPLIDHLTGTTADYSIYGELQGNLPAVIQLIAAAWLSAALGEELVFRVFLMHQLQALLGRFRFGNTAAILLGGVAFGLAHASQGISGIVQTGIVGALFGYVYLRSGRNLWVLVLAHGLVDTFGVSMAYFG